ncbi:DUF6226 family protein [Microbacterium sp. NPDC008134]|uniref:DUF6226 family protein n=1 Tax=Microbacterium sp. NPDC008134 TaxID=3364183 RepID=UPI0036ECEE21
MNGDGEGGDAFAEFVARRGVDPAALAGDLAALWTFVAAHPTIADSAALAESAARFLGNAIILVHPAATWRSTPELEVGTNTRSVPVAGLVQGILAHPDRLEDFQEMLASWEQDDLDDQEMQEVLRDSSTPALVVPAVAYRRPTLPTHEYLDDDGRIIRYGRRWPDGVPPEEAYSRESHPERFAPLRGVVDALVEHLGDSYTVEVSAESAGEDARRIVMQPLTGAPITLTVTGPVVEVEAGELLRTVIPSCTCDACDETAESAADELERTLLAIAAGGLRERFPVGRRAWQLTELVSPEGEGRSSSAGPTAEMPEEVRERTASVLRDLDDGWWPAWLLRTASPA